MIKNFKKVEARFDRITDIRILARKKRDKVTLEETEEEFSKALSDYKEAVYLKHSSPKEEIEDCRWDLKKLPKLSEVPESFI
jgi:hypothetical protein